MSALLLGTGSTSASQGSYYRSDAYYMQLVCKGYYLAFDMFAAGNPEPTELTLASSLVVCSYQKYSCKREYTWALSTEEQMNIFSGK